ncbi:MAG: heavy-metal-associated domain-containing protein, partial [Spirochaetota bacterium]
MKTHNSLELPIRGMDCAECASHVQKAIASVEGVKDADVLLGAEKAIVRFDVQALDMDRIRRAVHEAGYEVGEDREAEAESRGRDLTRKIFT